VPPRAGESNHTEIGVEMGIGGLLAFVAWQLALLAGLLRTAWTAPEATARCAAAGLAATLAAVLALGVQTDVYGVPWLAYGLWWLVGAVVAPQPAPAPGAARRPG